MSFSRLRNDPRVWRHAKRLAEAGYEVAAFGFVEPDDRADGFELIGVPTPGQRPVLRVGRILRTLPARLGRRAAAWSYWRSPLHRYALEQIVSWRPDVVQANDWATLPIAAALKGKAGARVVYDSHEFAREQRPDRMWRLTYGPYVASIEGAHIGSADRVMTVSPGIADALAAVYRLARTPTVVRSTPAYQATAPRDVGDTITVLYHGSLNPNRGLESLVASTAMWRDDFRLVLRGIGRSSYIDRLRALAERSGQTHRVVFDPPVGVDELVPEAAAADVGAFFAPPGSPQTEYVLPNKLFEYVMAGLCLCVSPSPDMAALVRHHDLGVVSTASDPQDIAAAINSLSRDAINRYRRNSLQAAQELNAETELERLLALYEGLTTDESAEGANPEA